MASNPNYTQITPRAAEAIRQTIQRVKAIPLDRRGIPNPANAVFVSSTEVLARVTSFDAGDGFYNIQIQKRKTPVQPFADDADLKLGDYFQDSFAAVMFNTAESGAPGVPALAADGSEYILVTPAGGKTLNGFAQSSPCYQCCIEVGPLLVRIDTLGGGSGGTYRGRVMTGGGSFSGVGGVDITGGSGLVAGDVNCLLINPAENGLPGWRLADGAGGTPCYAIGEVVGFSQGLTPNVPVIALSQANGDLARSQVSLTPGTYAEGDHKVWERDVDGHSVVVEVLTSGGFDTGSKTIWFRKRPFTHDAIGDCRKIDDEANSLEPPEIQVVCVEREVVIDVVWDGTNLKKVTEFHTVLAWRAGSTTTIDTPTVCT